MQATSFATHQHSRVNEALLSSVLTIFHKAWQIWYYPLPLIHTTQLKRFLSWGTKLLAWALLINIWWIF